MSGLIKAGSAAAGLILAPFGNGAEAKAVRAAPKQPEQHPLEREVGRLREELAGREAQIAKHDDELAQACVAAELAGRETAESEFEADRAAATERLEQGIAQARNDLKQAFEQAQALALLVARGTLDKLFGDPGERTEIISALLSEQLERVGRELVVAIDVSRLDFPDTGELKELSERLGLRPGVLEARVDLDEGTCRMRMRLGTIDLGIDRQWGAVRALIDEFCADKLEVKP